MREEKQIISKINSLKEEIKDLYQDRYEKIEKYKGISKEDNDDFLSDISFKNAEIKTLEWVLNN